MLIIPIHTIVRLILSVLLEAALVIKHATQVVTNARINAPRQSRSTDVMALALAAVFGNGLIPPPAILTVVLVEVAMVVKRIAALNARLVETVRTNA